MVAFFPVDLFGTCLAVVFSNSDWKSETSWSSKTSSQDLLIVSGLRHVEVRWPGLWAPADASGFGGLIVHLVVGISIFKTEL